MLACIKETLLMNVIFSICWRYVVLDEIGWGNGLWTRLKLCGTGRVLWRHSDGMFIISRTSSFCILSKDSEKASLCPVLIRSKNTWYDFEISCSENRFLVSAVYVD
jgi:hypothetical protein